MPATASRRRLPTQEQLRIWRDYIETAEALKGRLSARMQDESSLSSASYQVLLALNDADDHRLRSSVLAERVGWERSRLSHQLARMEERGLIRRDACAEDSRGAEVVLSAHGAESFRRAAVPHLRAVRQLFLDAFSSDELEHVEAVTTTLRGHLDRLRADGA